MSEFVCEVAPDEFGELTEVARLGEEIVRCRDCKHWREVLMSDGSKGHRCSGVFTFIEPNDNGYCAWGEKR